MRSLLFDHVAGPLTVIADLHRQARLGRLRTLGLLRYVQGVKPVQSELTPAGRAHVAAMLGAEADRRVDNFHPQSNDAR